MFFLQDSVHQVVITCYSLNEVAKVKKKIAHGLQNIENNHQLVVLDWEQLMPGLRQGIEIDLISGIIFYLLLILVVAFSIMNTFLMAIIYNVLDKA